MRGRAAATASFIILLMLLPLASSNIQPVQRDKGGFDAQGVWVESAESELHTEWWSHWSRDRDHDSLDDRLEWLLQQPQEVQQEWWKRAELGNARVFVDYDHHPSDADISELEKLGVTVTFRPKYLDAVSALSLIHI